MANSRFVIIKHEAKRAGLHYDFRFKLENSKMWASFAVPKGVPTTAGKKVLAVRTPDHTEADALFTGHQESGYGAGDFTKWDSGSCEILKMTDKHISLKLNGSKVKGVYHMFNIAKGTKQKQYYFFKGKGK
jgi:bifunctional non-homologous end joining protein LigD